MPTRSNHHPSPPECVIFDLDGTLIDSRDDIAAACNHALEQHGRAAIPMEVVRTFVGDGARLLLSRAFGLLAASAELDAPYATFLAYYQAHPVVKTTLLPGVHESLDALRGKKVALCTNKTRKTALLVLEALSLTDRFHAIFGAGDGPLKPDPFPVRFVLDAVGIPPERAWMVGDSPQDILAGRAAGCGATVGVLQGFTEPEKLHASEPDIVLDSLLALPVLVR